MPQIVWEAQRALTHSVLVLAMTICLFAVFWQVLERGRRRDYLLLGFVMGLGLLSKYNFILLPAGMIIAATAMPTLRGRLKWPFLLLSFLIAAVMVSPVAVWAINNPEIAGGSIHKLGLGNIDPFKARILGTTALIVGIAGFLGVAGVVLGSFFILRNRGSVAEAPLLLWFMAYAAGATLILLWIIVLVSGGTAVKDRWLMPLAWAFVPALTVWLWPLLRSGQQKVLGGIVLGLWVAAMALLPIATLFDPGYRSADFAALMDEVVLIEPDAKTVVSNSSWILGNLAFARPDLTVIRLDNAPDETFVLITEAGFVMGAMDGRASEPHDYSIVHGLRTQDVEIRIVTP